MADFLKDTVEYKERNVEIIKILFSLAFNLNLSTCMNAEVDYDAKKSSSYEVPFYRMTLGYKRYFLLIDKDLNIACTDSSDYERTTPYSGEIRPASNQIKIAYFLTNNNLVPQIVRENLEIL